VRFIGIDIDPEALRAANELQISGAFLRASGDRLPIADHSVDFVFSRVALPYMHIPRAVAEIHRVLRPGGSVWISLHRPRRVMIWLKEAILQGHWKAALAQSFSLISGTMLLLTNRQTRMPVTGRYLTFQTPEGMRKLVEKAGFQVTSSALEPFFVLQATKPAPKAARSGR
jgi:ubiquinone/menaquinone biosynthesis C-methylase UbiE